VTQNADGINEVLTIYGTNIVNAELLVFNRWGEKVGHAKGWQMDRLTWDGRGANGKPLKQDTYSYKLFYSVTSGKDFEKVGHVNILR
ncbi:MAG: gliding motility-associated C-terminal domain-containing protein, partial [Flavobacteriales bacterium]